MQHVGTSPLTGLNLGPLHWGGGEALDYQGSPHSFVFNVSEPELIFVA